MHVNHSHVAVDLEKILRCGSAESKKALFFPLATTFFRASKNGECLIVACRGSRVNCRGSRVKWRKPNVVSPALSFLSAKTAMLGSGAQCKISLIDTTKSRQQFKTTNGQSSNDSELFNNPNFDTDTYQWNWHRLKFVQSRHSPQAGRKGRMQNNFKYLKDWIKDWDV